MKINNFRVFADIWPLSQDCRDWGAPSRVYVRTPTRHVTIKTGLPYRGFELRHRHSYVNRHGAEVRVHDAVGRRWQREPFGVVARTVDNV